MNRVTVAIVLLFGTALALYWQVQQKKASLPQPEITDNRPDFVATDLKSLSFDDEGKLESKVSATYMEHFDSTALTVFSNPIYTLFPKNGGGEWQITAKIGKLDKFADKVTLENEVQVQALSFDEPLQQLTTSYLALDIGTMILTSDKHIHISGNNFQLNGIGLYADLNKEEVKLLSEIKGIYEPK